MEKVKKILLSFFLFVVVNSCYPCIFFNEVMQSNVYDIIDDINEFPDSWVELYNDDSIAVSLDGFLIGLSSDSVNVYEFPENISIAAKEYLIIYCDKESIGLHTNFRLNSSEEDELYLKNTDGEIVDFLVIPQMPAPNISYGKKLKDGTWSYFRKSTPGKINEEVSSNYVLSKPKFSIKGGCYKDSVVLKLSLDKLDKDIPNVCIRYTTDGSEPTDSSFLYVDSLIIRQSVVIKAKTFHDSLVSKPSKVHSYLFIDRDITLPIVSLSLDSSYLYDDEIGIYVSGTYGENHPEQQSSVPLAGNDNFLFSWNRPVTFEYFDMRIQKEALLNQLCEVKIGGNFTRKCKVKSLVLNANKRFGEKRFDYPFWDSKPKVKKSKSLYLRNGGNDFSNAMLRDAVSQMSVGLHTNLDWQAYQPVIVFVNGEYEGILNLRERAHEDYVWANYNHLENIDFIKNETVGVGDKKAWNMFKNKYNSSETTYKEMSEMLDVDEFLNFFITECFYANVDFPSNNSKKYRPREDSARWRFFTCDLDNSWGYKSSLNPSFPYLNYILRTSPFPEISNSEVSCKIYQKMMSFDTFKTCFIDRFSVYLGTFLSDTSIVDLIDSVVCDVEYEIPFYWEDILKRDMLSYYAAVDTMKNWVKERVPFMYEHIGAFFNQGNPISLQIKEVKGKDSIFFNNIPLYKNQMNGMYYANREFHLFQKNQSNKWTVSYYLKNDSVVKESFYSDTLNFTIPVGAKNVVIDNSAPSETNNFEIFVGEQLSKKLFREGDLYEIYDMTGKLIRKTKDLNSLYGGLKGSFVVRVYEKLICIDSYRILLL